MNVRALAHDARAIGALVVGAVGVGVAWLVGRTPPGTEPEPPPVEPGSRPRAWVRLDGSPILLRPGERYRGCVKLPWYVPRSAVSEERVRAYAEKQGFGDVRVVPSTDCDVLVHAQWQRGYHQMDRPSALVGAWALRDTLEA